MTNEVTNAADQNTLHKMTYNAKKLLRVDHIEVLVDSGYNTGEEFIKCTKDNIAPRTQAAYQKNNAFRKDKFAYNNNSDTYTCPQDHILQTNGKWCTKKREKDSKFKECKLQYRKCNDCKFKNECPGKRLNRKQGRVIEPYQFEDYTEDNLQRVKENKEYYRRRQTIVEHLFGTIKRQWAYTYTLLKGKEKFGGEFDLICLSYNIRRSVSILGIKELIRGLKALKTTFFCEIIFGQFQADYSSKSGNYWSQKR